MFASQSEMSCLQSKNGIEGSVDSCLDREQCAADQSPVRSADHATCPF